MLQLQNNNGPNKSKWPPTPLKPLADWNYTSTQKKLDLYLLSTLLGTHTQSSLCHGLHKKHSFSSMLTSLHPIISADLSVERSRCFHLVLCRIKMLHIESDVRRSMWRPLKFIELTVTSQSWNQFELIFALWLWGIILLEAGFKSRLNCTSNTTQTVAIQPGLTGIKLILTNSSGPVTVTFLSSWHAWADLHVVFCFSAHHRCNKWLCRLPWTSCPLQPICLFSSARCTVSGLYLHNFTWCTANDWLTEKLQDWASVNQRPRRPTPCYKIRINQLIVLSTGPFVFKAILKRHWINPKYKVILLYNMLLLVNKPSPASINMKKVDRMQPGVRSV